MNNRRHDTVPQDRNGSPPMTDEQNSHDNGREAAGTRYDAVNRAAADDQKCVIKFVDGLWEYCDCPECEWRRYEADKRKKNTLADAPNLSRSDLHAIADAFTAITASAYTASRAHPDCDVLTEVVQTIRCLPESIRRAIQYNVTVHPDHAEQNRMRQQARASRDESDPREHESDDDHAEPGARKTGAVS